MNKKLIVIGDLHFRSTIPFYNAQKELIKWVHKQSWNNSDNIYLNLGDTFNNSLPDPKTTALVLEFFQGLNFNKCLVLSGSHDYNGVKHQNALRVLYELDKNIEIIEFLQELKIGNLNCLLAPYFYPSQIGNKEIVNMYSFYNNLPEEFYNKEYDYLFSHIEDETQNFGNNKYVDFSKLKIKKRRSGHIHNASDNFLGVPVLTKYDEKNHKPKILEIDLETGKEIFHDVPMFIKYVDVDYPNDLEFQTEYYNLFTIKNCIDKESAKVYYENKHNKDKELFFRGFYKKSENEKSIISESSNDKETLTIEQHFNNFFEENKIEQDLKDTCFGYWRG